ncbi:PucR family transcriptional regulator [Baekduia soli]|uniref:PucR family transcriptional regulator n=1 Tax=Baekduia soli TaxID=496014 RepID=A0A5B8U1G6_9ACTN|nr:PucR family transcriptional regulator [Baekduia soli]QEC46914.1 PucR family transcriptional regulator [Baekduia soli]
MVVTARWEPPSPRVTALIRAAAQAFVDDPSELLDEVDAAVLAAAPERIAGDAVITAATVATNHANILHWAQANVRRPGAPVPANLSAEVLDLARDIVRRGLDDTTLNTYRIGQNVAWRAWMVRAFTLTDDPDELRELLDVTARSIFAFVDATVAGIQERIDAEREGLARGTHAERLETVNLILEGAPITSARASARLRYELDRRHTAAIVWGDGEARDPGGLETAADALARAAGARRPFTVVAGTRTLWAWFADGGAPQAEAVRAHLQEAPGVRIALGTTAEGMEGFRRSHLDALATQRLMHRMPGGPRLAGYEDVQLVALTAADEEAAWEFVRRTLGDLAAGDPELRETLRVYIREEFSASRAARALYAHRNTVLNRLGRARELLPVALEHHGLQVGLALEIVAWLGPAPGTPLRAAAPAAR